ncbi:helix-turn-helix transcriptional regulator [Saccharomonospora sp. NPDC046836]|uniref:helix-turn-helix domain-containing protein n=1 Tax=Saccharomonospora sp. NPDC046836 TaxID=3156921 RepID=UPI0033E6FDFA
MTGIGTARHRRQQPIHRRPSGTTSTSSFGTKGTPPQYPILGYSQALRSACPVEKSIYSAEYQRLCQLLREARHEAGLTQVQVAERLGVPQSFVSKYETGERRLDVIELRHVAQALALSLSTIVSRLGLEPSDDH